MAKIVNVTYGTKGDTAMYTYVVNDNVRNGDYITPTVKHYISGKEFSTTGIVQQGGKATGKLGQELALNAYAKMEKGGKDPTLEKAFTGKELGVKPEQDASGKYKQVGGLGKTVKDTATNRFTAPQGKEFKETAYIKETREKALEKRKENGGMSFDEYAKQFEE